jgi:hypothetical protein
MLRSLHRISGHATHTTKAHSTLDQQVSQGLTLTSHSLLGPFVRRLRYVISHTDITTNLRTDEARLRNARQMYLRDGADSFAQRVDAPLSPDRSMASASAAFDYRDTSKMGSSGPYACVQHKSSLVGSIATAGARLAAGGALREVGKLILILSLAELCDMLHARDDADDFELILHGLLGTLLTELGR